MNDQELINFINDRLTYEPDTGIFRHKISGSGKRVGAIAGSLNPLGYVRLTFNINGKFAQYKAHRIAWLLTYGKWPSNFIDHINRQRDDNRIDNLRDVTPEINANNTSQTINAKGWTKNGNRYRAQISVNGKQKKLGHFDTPEEARAAYLQARENKNQQSRNQ